MKPVHLTQKEFTERVANAHSGVKRWKYLGDKPAVVDFYTSWCGPCRLIAPILEELAQEYAGRIHIYQVDAEAEYELASMFNIRSIPTLLFIPMEGRPHVARRALSKERFIEAIESVLLG